MAIEVRSEWKRTSVLELKRRDTIQIRYAPGATFRVVSSERDSGGRGWLVEARSLASGVLTRRLFDEREFVERRV